MFILHVNRRYSSFCNSKSPKRWWLGTRCFPRISQLSNQCRSHGSKCRWLTHSHRRGLPLSIKITKANRMNIEFYTSVMTARLWRTISFWRLLQSRKGLFWFSNPMQRCAETVGKKPANVISRLSFIQHRLRHCLVHMKFLRYWRGEIVFSSQHTFSYVHAFRLNSK